MDKIDKLIELVDNELEYHTPGTDAWKDLLENREALIKQKDMLKKQSKKNGPNPDTIMNCITGLVQVVGLAVVGWATRIDREAIRFIKKP